MLCFLGLRLQYTLTDRQKYKECLQEMKHYLSLRKVQIFESDYVLTASNQTFTFSLPKNPSYLHTNFYNMPLFNSNDYQFLDTCYECLMIIQESFPINVNIELVSDCESQELLAFQEKKEEELNRRINSNLRTLAQKSTDLTTIDVETILFLMHHHYTRKNRAIAIKFLLAKVAPNNAAELSQQYIELLGQLEEEGDLRKGAGQLLGRIRSMQADFQRQKQNLMKSSNLSSQNKYGDSVKLQPVMFLLRESYNLERVCTLLHQVLASQQQKQYYSKLESSISTVVNKFMADEFEQASKFAEDFLQLIKRYWSKRGKKWEQTILNNTLQNKVRSLCLIPKNNQNKSRTITSRNA